MLIPANIYSSDLSDDIKRNTHKESISKSLAYNRLHYQNIMKMAELATTLTYIFCAILFFYIGLCSGRTLSGKSILTPVVIVPGHGGNQVMMKIDRKEPIRPGCPTSTGGWVQGWLDLWNFLPSRYQNSTNLFTFESNISTMYDSQTMIN